MNNTLSVVMYHYVRDIAQSRYPRIKGLELSTFREQLEFLKQRYHLISCDQLLDALNGGSLPQNSMLLTFDDGYIDHYTNVFPLLMKDSIPAFFSMPGKLLTGGGVLDVNKIHVILACETVEKLLPIVFERLDYYRGLEYAIPSNKELYEKLAQPSRFDTPETIFIKRLLQVELPEDLRHRIVDDVLAQLIPLPEAVLARELYMSMEQVRLMARSGMTFGIHGYDHYWMNRLPQTELEKDIELALEVFDGIVDKDNWLCCYPYGSWDENVIETVKKYGAAAGFATEVNIVNFDNCNRYAMPRLDTNDYPPESENYKLYENGAFIDE